MSKIPLSSMDRILRDVEVERVSDSAKEALREVLADEAKRVTKRASEIARHAGRTTILKSDISLFDE